MLDLLKRFLLFCPPSEINVILQSKDRCKSIKFPRQISYESPQIINLEMELLRISLTFRNQNFLDNFNFLKIYFYAILINNEA